MDKTELEFRLALVVKAARDHGNAEASYIVRAQAAFDQFWERKNLRAAQRSKLAKINAQTKAAHLRAEIAAL